MTGTAASAPTGKATRSAARAGHLREIREEADPAARADDRDAVDLEGVRDDGEVRVAVVAVDIERLDILEAMRGLIDGRFTTHLHPPAPTVDGDGHAGET